MNRSLSDSSVSLTLTNIQKRCEALMEDNELVLQLEDALVLQLEDGVDQRFGTHEDKFNPYKRAV